MGLINQPGMGSPGQTAFTTVAGGNLNNGYSLMAQQNVNGVSVLVGPEGLPPPGVEVVWAMRAGTFSSPIATVLGVTSGQFNLPQGRIIIPAGMLQAMSRISVEGFFRRRNANATGTVNTRIGTTASSSDISISSVILSATNNLDFRLDTYFTITNANTISRVNWISPNTTNPSSGSDVSSANINTASEMYISFDVSVANTGDAFDLISYLVRIIR